MDLILWFFELVGHLGFWCVIFNRVHATKWPRKARKLFEKFVILAVALPVLYFFVQGVRFQTISFVEFARFDLIHSVLLWAGLFLGCFFTLRWCYRKFLVRPPAAIKSRSQDFINVQQELGRSVYVGKIATLLSRVPFNQCHLISRNRMTWAISGLPKSLDGLKICQLSDLHLTGMMSLEYFDRVVEEVNRFGPDLIVITGDLIDSYECLDWIDQVFGRLESRLGKFYVLGNHDKRIKDEAMLRDRLASADLIPVGGVWEQVAVSDVTIRLAGNELPWYNGAETLAPMQENGESGPVKSFKILLSHSPDQIDWAKSFGFDLMFAGHNHGGQIALPIVGPIVAPSKYGVLYASGTFQIGETLLHVSRGLSGDECIRINSPPEIGMFTLTCTE